MENDMVAINENNVALSNGFAESQNVTFLLSRWLD